MVADKENGKNLFGRPRRSSFVAASEENADFVPILPAVGSTPIPAASDVNFFPTVATGQPSLREPAAPARLVVPTRKSMSEEEIATVFVESADMTSSEQIGMLDAQVTLREDDFRTAKEFVAVLRTAKPSEAQPLLDELKQIFADVDPRIASLSLGDQPAMDSPSAAIDDVIAATPNASETTPAASPAVVAEPTPKTVGIDESSSAASVNGRYRGWSAVMFMATVFAVLIPVTSAVFTAFGSPVPGSVESMLGPAGIFVVGVALLAVTPLVLLARSTSIRHALTTRAAIQRAAGVAGGTVLSIFCSLAGLVGLLTVLLATSQGVGLQLSSIPGVTSTLAQFAPQAHVSVIVVAVIVLAGFGIASLPRAAYRGLLLALGGFTLVGPAVVIIIGMAVVATSGSAGAFTLENIIIATGIIPICVILFAGVESGVATLVRRDEKPLYGISLYIGLAAGIGYAAWVLLAGIGSDALGNVFVGSNPALHIVASSTELAFLAGTIAFAVPLVLITALIGRSLMMTTVSDDRAAGSWLIRTIVLIVPLTVLGLDLTGVAGDITAVLPGIPFVSIPLMVIVGLMAGASVASRRELSGVARVLNAIFAMLLMVVGLALTSWSVPGLANIYDSAIAPLASSLGLSGTVTLVVPTGILVFTFVLSLLVSTFGVVRPKRNA
ncbi:MAG: hypothetical protein K9G02_03080 [Microbacteriaceae bacterium]|nr:hypothetical protein [Microbacteriaceae bacterium]